MNIVLSHIPESRGHEFEERTWVAIVLYNQEFNTDCRVKAGKHHYSLDKTILFPLSDIHDIVPPILHINLGVVLMLFEHLLSFIRDLDKEEGNHSVNLEAENELTVHHAEVVQLEQMISDMAWEYIYYFNLRDRLKNVGNKDKLRDIARFSARENTRHKDARVEKCVPKEFCCITSFDNNVLWVQCEKCSAWKHTMCECMLTSEKALDLLPEYICLTCNLAHSRENIVTQRLCKQEAYANIGPREESLNLTLTELNVHREVYHGNVFVGNHCKIINNNYEKLIAVIEDKHADHGKFLNVFRVFSETSLCY